MINDELLLDEALRRNEINEQCRQPHDEISPPEEFQTKAEEESAESHHSPSRKPFSRSVSIGGGGRPRQMASIADNTRSNGSPRKRNSSYETSAAAGEDPEQDSDSLGPADFLSNPSPALQNLFGSSSSAWSGLHYAVSADILQRPVMSFVLQWNDLESLQIAMTMALRKSACRTFAMQGCVHPRNSITRRHFPPASEFGEHHVDGLGHYSET